MPVVRFFAFGRATTLSLADRHTRLCFERFDGRVSEFERSAAGAGVYRWFLAAPEGSEHLIHVTIKGPWNSRSRSLKCPACQTRAVSSPAAWNVYPRTVSL